MTRLRKILFALATALVPFAAAAQDPWPTKPIKVVIPFPPGGAVDTLIRTLAPDLQATLGQSIVVENRPGGGAQIGAAALMTAPADGYTVFAAEIGAFAINPTLYKSLSYQPVRDFEGIAMLVRTPMVMYGANGGKLASVKALKDALESGAPVNYGSFGPGTAPHILGHQLSKAAPKANFTHVPYKGPQAANQGFMGGEIDLLFDGVPGAMNMARSGKSVSLAVAAPRRSEYLPDVPTTAELGWPQMVMDLWIGVVARKGTPSPVIAKLNAAFDKAMANPDTRKRFADIGFSREQMAPAQFNAFIKSEIDRYRPIIVETGAVVD